MAREVAYFYQNDRLSHEIWKVSNLPVDPPDTYKFEFGYDAKGNLNLVKNYQLDSLQQYTLLETIEYSDFDDRINPTSWMLRYPYLPQMQYQLNNPRKEVRYPAGGGSVTTNFQYEYNTQDLPVSQQKTTNTGSLTTQYQY